MDRAASMPPGGIAIDSATIAPARLGPEFVARNRSLRAADAPDSWEPAARGMDELLDRLASTIDSGAVEGSWSASQSSRLLSVLLTVVAEAGQYRHEQATRRDLLVRMAGLRTRATGLAKRYLSLPTFDALRGDIDTEIHPLLDSMLPAAAPDRFMPFRVIQIGNVVERLYELRLRTTDPLLSGGGQGRGLLQEIYNRKYLRFGTSGVRARWGVDFTEARARHVVQAICDFLNDVDVPGYVGAEDLRGRRVVVGYDSRRNASTVAGWVAEVCLGNGFLVDLANRDTPTPTLVYHLTDHLAADDVAGLINCTASHNPPEWQGIKFNPPLGYPAPTNVTDHIAARINELQLLDAGAHASDLDEARADGRLRGFDPIANYTAWIEESGHGNGRIHLDLDRIRRFFSGRHVVVDEMHGAGRGYLSKLLGEIGVRHTILHPEQDPGLPGLDYANPEEPYVEPLKEEVRRSGAALGLALDTDADRFGIVDAGGDYFRPNQVLPMLVRYLAVDRGLHGRVIATQTGSPLIEVLAGMSSNPDEFKPEPGVVPAYVAHAFYRTLVGSASSRACEHTFLVPVGVKYVEEQRRTDRAYRPLRALPPNWRDTLLIGGEESSGLTTRGHVPDKDGVWGDLLVMDMLAYYGAERGLDSIQAIWDSTCALPGCWQTYGGFEPSNSGRADVDAVLEAKEALIDYFLDLDPVARQGGPTYAGLQIVYLGGVRYDIAELQLRDEGGDDRHFLRVRASGTEPINRIYVESSDREIAARLVRTTLGLLEELCIREVRLAATEWRLAEILAYTSCSATLLAAVREHLAGPGAWSGDGVVAKLELLVPTLERRSQRTARAWVEALRRS